MDFLKALPEAAKHPLALAAYAVAAVLFLFAGQGLVALRLVLRQLRNIPPADRRAAIEIATNTKLPTTITADQWIRVTRMRLAFLLAAGILLCGVAIAAIAMARGRELQPKLQLHDITK